MRVTDQHGYSRDLAIDYSSIHRSDVKRLELGKQSRDQTEDYNNSSSAQVAKTEDGITTFNNLELQIGTKARTFDACVMKTSHATLPRFHDSVTKSRPFPPVLAALLMDVTRKQTSKLQAKSSADIDGDVWHRRNKPPTGRCQF